MVAVEDNLGLIFFTNIGTPPTLVVVVQCRSRTLPVIGNLKQIDTCSLCSAPNIIPKKTIAVDVIPSTDLRIVSRVLCNSDLVQHSLPVSGQLKALKIYFLMYS